MQDNYQDWIDPYLEGSLTETQKQEFLQACAQDETLAKSLQQRQQMAYFLQAKAQEPERIAQIQLLQEQYFPVEEAQPKNQIIPMFSRRTIWRMAAVAAGLAIMLLVGLRWWNHTPPRLYAHHATHYPIALVPKGGNSKKVDIQRLEDAFIQNKWAIALPLLQEYQQAYPQDPQGTLYLGITHLELDQLELARQQFRALAQGKSTFRSEAQWYLALSYLKEGDLESTKDWLAQIEESAQRYQQAQELYEAID